MQSDFVACAETAGRERGVRPGQDTDLRRKSPDLGGLHGGGWTPQALVKAQCCCVCVERSLDSGTSAIVMDVVNSAEDGKLATEANNLEITACFGNSRY